MSLTTDFYENMIIITGVSIDFSSDTWFSSFAPLKRCNWGIAFISTLS